MTSLGYCHKSMFRTDVQTLFLINSPNVLQLNLGTGAVRHGNTTNYGE